MSKTNLIQALEAVLDELRKPTITFTPLKQEPLDDREISHGFRISKKAILYIFKHSIYNTTWGRGEPCLIKSLTRTIWSGVTLKNKLQYLFLMVTALLRHYL